MRRYLILSIIIVVIAFALRAISSSQKNRVVETLPHEEGPYEKINIIGDSPLNGVYDPSLEYADEIGWLAYSAVDGNAQPFGPNVHTHLAQSSDQGKTWRFVKTINESHNDTLNILGKGKEKGVWRYEVPSIVYDPKDPGREWKLFFHKYFWTKKHDRLVQYGWIGYRTASNPAGTWSDEIALFGAGRLPLAPFRSTRVDLHTLHQELKTSLVFTEPGVMESNGVLYMSLSGVTKNGDPTVFLLRSRNHARSWEYVGTLLTTRDGKGFGFDDFDGTSLAKNASGNDFYLLASPMTRERGVEKHNGTFMIQFENLEHGHSKT